MKIYKTLIKVLISFFLLTTFSWAETVTVVTKENAIREYPKFFAPVKTYVRYGDILNLISKEKDWYKVKFKNITGYIHKTAVETRTVLTYGSYTSSATTSEGEITLAGKGFNPQVERGYRNKYPQMRYDIVDKIEKYYVSEKELMAFIKDGGLIEP